MQANKIKAEVLKSIFEKNYLDNPYELETIINDLTAVYFDFTQLMADIPDRDQLPPQDILGRDLFTIRFLRDIFKEIIKADQVNQTPTRGHQRPIRSRSGQPNNNPRPTSLETTIFKPLISNKYQNIRGLAYCVCTIKTKRIKLIGFLI